MSENHTPPMVGLLLAKADFEDADHNGYGEDSLPELGAGIEHANLLTSLSNKNLGKHKVVIDLDLPAKLIDSTTPGHHHLLIDHELDWGRYKKLLNALTEAGLVEAGYLNASEDRGYTAVRLPWVKKEGAAIPKPKPQAPPPSGPGDDFPL